MKAKISPTLTLSEYAISTSFNLYPPEVIERAKWIIVDTIGCMFGGVPTALGQSMLTTLIASGARIPDYMIAKVDDLLPWLRRG